VDLVRQDDDDEERALGPPPDPSVRAWRHPSEIAAAGAAAARLARQEQAEAARLLRLAYPSSVPQRSLGGVAVVAAALALATLAASALAVTTLGITPSDDAASGSVLEPGRISAHNILGSELMPSVVTTRLGATAPSGSGRTVAPRPYETPGSAPIDETEPVAQGVYARIEGQRVRLAAFTVIDELVVTTASAVDRQRALTVSYQGMTASANVVASDPLTDIALLTLSGEEGHALIATMAAHPADTTVSADVTRTDDTARTRAGDSLYGVLETAMNCLDGASGAPLVDDQGHLVGLVLNAASPYLLALPAELVGTVARALEAWHQGSPAWIGVNHNPWDDESVVIGAIEPESPAADVLRPGDQIVTVGGIEVEGWRHFVYLLREAGPGSTLSLGVVRDGVDTELDITISTRPVPTDDASMALA
jgi:S1-C subfamily serine protease